jgi:YD repeat-containing protein
VTGFTQSSNFPLANTYAGGTCGTRNCYDAFAFRLDLATNTLTYSTYLGGGGDDEGNGITVDRSGNAYLTGYTKSSDFPVASAIQSTKGADGCNAPPCADAFVTKMDASGSALVYSTYFGGGGDDQGNGIALDGEGGVYVAGEGNSVDFPVTPGAYDTALNGTKDDAFVVKISEAAPPPSSWTTTYTYTYDPLYRLAGATYSSGEFFEYTYDAVGNRLSETTHLGTATYTYDNANRLADVNGVAYTWDDNGNLLSDGVNTYTYDDANRLTSVVGPTLSSSTRTMACEIACRGQWTTSRPITLWISTTGSRRCWRMARTLTCMGPRGSHSTMPAEPSTS